MIIDINNADTINSSEVYIHDDILNKLEFVRSKCKLILFMIDETETHPYTIEFVNVIGFEMTNCDFWGRSPHIYHFEYMSSNDQHLIPKLINHANNHLSYFKSTDKASYVETSLTFTSGDELNIACEYIVYNK